MSSSSSPSLSTPTSFVALARLDRACASICAEGTDSSVVAQVLSWVVRPRRSTDVLRRRCRDAGTSSRSLSTELASAARDVTATDADAAGEIVTVWQRLGVRVALIGDPSYPARLAEGWPTTDGPVLLAWRGEGCTEAPAVAIVGSRRASGYGRSIAAWLADGVASAGVRVVSGGAVGIDAAAHGAALEHSGGTTVVLGCGHAVAYPRNHARDGGLFDRVLEHGGTIVSELLPYERPKPGLVRARNRIVAGLADAVVVVEGADRSGALLTANAAAERDRMVLAVPGDIRAPGSAAPHRLLTEGAGPCTGPGMLLDAIAVSAHDRIPLTAAGPEAGDRNVVPSALPPAVHAALRAAWPRPLRVDDLATLTSTSVPVLLGALTRARMAGEVAEGVDGVRLRHAPEHSG